MKMRLWLAIATCVVGATVFAGSAVADPPTVEESSPVGDKIVCGETNLTVRTGTIVTRTHVHPLPNGRFHVIVTQVPRGVTATEEGVPLEEATVYQIRGVAHGSFTTPDPDKEGGEVGLFRFKINILGPGGLFGTINFRIQDKRNGDEVIRDRGTCEFVLRQ
jgi:hypothetical protein